MQQKRLTTEDAPLVRPGAHFPIHLAQIWMCVNERLEFEDCDQACPGHACQNANCAHPMLFPPPQPHDQE